MTHKSFRKNTKHCSGKGKNWWEMEWMVGYKYRNWCGVSIPSELAEKFKLKDTHYIKLNIRYSNGQTASAEFKVTSGREFYVKKPYSQDFTKSDITRFTIKNNENKGRQSTRKIPSSINDDVDEINFQEQIQSVNIDSNIQNETAEMAKKGNGKKSGKWKRDPKKSAAALNAAGFKCEINRNHKTFKSGTKGRLFVEAHHLIPMKFQDEFLPYSLDVIPNIIAICPNCHRKLHYASSQEILKIIKKVLKRRSRMTRLAKCKIDPKCIDKYY